MKPPNQTKRSLTNVVRGALTVAAIAASLAIAQSHAAPVQLVSSRNTAAPVPAGGNADSASPAISADGRFVLFSSSANNLATNDNDWPGLDVFLRDRASNTSVLVSANYSSAGGGNGNSINGRVSTNGRYVVFESDASDLISGDTNDATDVFVRDLQLGSNILVSVANDGSWANGASTDPVMTPDGRFVSFISAATNLVTGDTNGLPDIFVRDLLNSTTALVSVGATGALASVSSPGITPDGRYVVFSSTAKGMAPGISASSQGEVYVRDLVANTTIWASANAANVVSNTLHLNYMPSSHPTISTDGQFVCFKTGGTNTPALSKTMLFQFNLSNATLTIISSNGFPAWVQNDDVNGPEMSPDGRFAAYVATNTRCVSVQLWDAQTGTNVLVSATMDGSYPTNSVSDTPSVSADGRFVVFMSNATNLATNTVASGFHIYRRDVQEGTTHLIDVDTNGIGSVNPVMTAPTLSADGRFVTFASVDDGLVNGGKNGALDIFLRDVDTGATELISTRDPGLNQQAGDSWSFFSQSALSDDGRKLVFTSVADDLVPNDTNGTLDVFLYDVVSGANALVSADVNGNPAGGGSSSPALALGGQLVAFVSTATNLVPERTNLFANVFLRDMLAGTNCMISVAANGVTPGNGDASSPAISADGRYAAFASRAGNLAPGASSTSVNVYLRDLANKTTTLLTNNASGTLAPSLSADGRYVVYFGSGSQVMVRDTQRGTNIFAMNSASTAAVSPTGARLLVLTNASKTLSVIDLVNRTIVFTIAASSPIRISAPWSSDGRFFTFVTATNADSSDLNHTNDVYLCDLSGNTLTLISANAAHTGAGNDVSDAPAISGDGRFVIYRSFATNLVANTPTPPNIFLYDCITGSNSLLTVAASGPAWSSWMARPAINGDGSVVAYQGWNQALVTGDWNRTEDVFAKPLSPWGTADSDSEGIPDLWMMHYFGHSTGLASDLSRAQDDADGDGMSNWQEFLAGTDPTSQASNLRLQIVAQGSSANGATLNWPVVPGKHYRIQFKNDLIDAGWSELNGLTILGSQGTFIAPMNQTNRFYRVAAE